MLSWIDRNYFVPLKYKTAKQKKNQKIYDCGHEIELHDHILVEVKFRGFDMVFT